MTKEYESNNNDILGRCSYTLVNGCMIYSKHVDELEQRFEENSLKREKVFLRTKAMREIYKISDRKKKLKN